MDPEHQRTAAARPGAGALRTATLATIALGVVVLVMSATQGGPSYFVGFGEEGPVLGLAREVLGDDVSVPLADGHDGQGFWLLARDPALTGGAELARYLDRPLYRAQRIGYPALAAPWGLLGEEALLWGLVGLNLAAAGVGTFLISRSFARGGGPAAAGYLFAANPLVWLSLLFDFCDALALVGLVWFALAVRGRRIGLAATFGVLAGLTKESSMLGMAAVALASRGLSLRQRALLVGPATLAMAAWRLYVMSRPGFGSDPEVQEFALLPFSGFEEAWRRGWVPNDHWLYAAMSLALIPLAVIVVRWWWQRRESVELLAALPYALYLPFLSGQVLSIPINSVRAFGPALTLAGMGWLRGRSPGARPR